MIGKCESNKINKMRANNLTISVPTDKCKMNCPYCVSKMTPHICVDYLKFNMNLRKARRVAEAANVSNILVTAKGEALDSLGQCDLVRRFFSDYPIEIQVNGHRYIHANSSELLELEQYDVVALSFDYIPVNFVKKTLGLIRMTFVVTDQFDARDFRDLIRFCVENDVDQLSLRNPTIPSNTVDTNESNETVEWIIKNTKKDNYTALIESFKYLSETTDLVVPLRKLEFGATIYDVGGISFTYFDYCVQDQSHDDDIRSLIYMGDGHLYTSWSYSSSKIF